MERMKSETRQGLAVYKTRRRAYPKRSEPWKRFEQESGLFGRKAYGLCVNGSERELALSGMPFEREEVKIQKTLGNRNRA